LINNKLQTFNQSQHGISVNEISPSARAIITKLLESNFQAFIVGGAVRDLLLGINPKDFDIATNATPDQIKNIFKKHCRIIGKRFKLAHVYHNKEMYEVATFRGVDASPERIVKQGHIIKDNVYGSIDQDALRRDFTCNALYFDIENANILDYCSGFDDIKNHELHFIGDDTKRIIEDPIRMIRAIRFQVKLGMTLSDGMKNAILEQHKTLSNVSLARLFDELVKLFHCGNAFDAYVLMNQLLLFQHIFPHASQVVEQSPDYVKFTHNALNSTDFRIKNGKSITSIFLFACFLWPLAVSRTERYISQGCPQYDAMNKSANEVFELSRKTLSIPRMVQIGIRNIWLLQFRFQKTGNKKVFFTLDHPRFRAAYDFLLLRKHESPQMQSLGDWWTHIQTLNRSKQRELIFQKKRVSKR